MLNNNFNNENLEDYIDIKEEFFKYLFFWRWFVISIVFVLLSSFFFLRYSHDIYETTAKIKIIDKNETSLELPSVEDLFSTSKINLENEIELLSSFSILSEVVKKQSLNTKLYGVGDIMEGVLVKFPFKFEQLVFSKEFKTYLEKNDFEYEIFFNDNGVKINDLFYDTTFYFNSFSTYNTSHSLPFNLEWDKKSAEISKENSYKVIFSSVDNTVRQLKNDLLIQPVGQESDIIEISIKTANTDYAQIILNTIIDVFNKDGITDRQLIHKRTIDFVNERYSQLSFELDSIEIKKQLYKFNNDLIDISVNSSLSLELSSKSELQLLELENEITITKLLYDSFSNNNFDLLPANIGIKSNEINLLISDYNSIILERNNLITSAGLNNPSIIQLNRSISDIRTNIVRSINNHLDQLNQTKNQLTLQSTKFNKDVSNLPEKEKILRALERNQIIKESLYLFLLQKREEAEVSFAVTEPTIKVIEYALSSQKPISPNTSLVLIIAILIGFLFPFVTLYIIFILDNKIHSRVDLENFSLNVLAEIPFFDLSETEKVFTNPDDRSIISESFRMLMSNVRYLQKNDSESNVILVTSSIKGEGKTLNALNLALSFSSVGKKVLLIGCDLRNPQLHKYINYDKNVPGLVDFLVDNTSDWKKNIINPFDSQPLDILLSGPLPPNPLNLLNNGNIDILLKDSRKTYDHIIIDSAPTLLVADTQSLINKSDVLIFMTRCNVTDNDVLSHIKKVSEEPDTNVGVILNGVGEKNSYGYSYGYRYGYGYNYKYSYNYGYGYGYNEESS